MEPIDHLIARFDLVRPIVSLTRSTVSKNARVFDADQVDSGSPDRRASC